MSVPQQLSGKGGLLLVGVGAAVALVLLVKNATAKGPNVEVLPPEAAPPPEDWVKARWIQPAMSALVNVPYFDIPFVAAREIQIQIAIRNRGPGVVVFRPEVRLSYGGEYFSTDEGLRSNVALEALELGPGVERIIQGTLPFEGPAAIGGQTVYATIHGRVAPAGTGAGADRDLETIVFFTT